MTIKKTGKRILNYMYEKYMKDHSQVTPEKELAEQILCAANELAGTINYLAEKKLIRREQFFDYFRWNPNSDKKARDFFSHCQPVTHPPPPSSSDLKFKQECEVAQKKDGYENEVFYVKITAKGIDTIEEYDSEEKDKSKSS